MNNARFLQDCRIPAGNWDGDAVAEKLNQTLAQEYPNVGNLVKTVMNYQVFSTVTSSRKQVGFRQDQAERGGRVEGRLLRAVCLRYGEDDDREHS